MWKFCHKKYERALLTPTTDAKFQNLASAKTFSSKKNFLILFALNHTKRNKIIQYILLVLKPD